MKQLLRLLGISIITLYIYFRFLMKKMPKDLIFVYKTNNLIIYNYTIIVISIMSMLISTIVIIFLLKKLYGKVIIIPQNIIKKVINIIFIYLKETLFAIKEIIAHNIPNSYIKLNKLCSIFYKKFGCYERLLCFVLILIPYLIVVLCFIIDVFYYFHLNYFYKSIPILIVPLIFHTFLYFMEDLVTNIDAIEEEILVEYSFIDNKDKFSFATKDKYPISKDTFEFYVSEYLKLIPLKGFLRSYFKIEAYYKTRVFLIIHILYLFGWFYVIYNNILIFI